MEHREALVGVERPRLDEIALVGLAAQRLHGAGQHVPVEHLLLARGLDGVQGHRAPGGVITRAESLVEPAIGLDVGVELVVLVGEERVRPAGGGDEGGAPGAVAHDARRGRADLHATLRRGRRRVEIGLGQRMGQAPATTALGDHAAAVAVHLEGDDRVREADAVVGEIEERVEEGVGQAGVVQRLVGVRHVDALLQEAPRQVLAGLAVARVPEDGIRDLAPHVVGGVTRAMPRLHLVVGEDAVGGNDVVDEVLVLVVAPDDDDFGLELVEELARAPEVRGQAGPVHRGGGGAAILPVLLAPRRGPVRGLAITHWQAGVAQHCAQDGGHILVPTDERGVVRHAEAQDLAHAVFLLAVRVSDGAAASLRSGRSHRRLGNPRLGPSGCQLRTGALACSPTPGRREGLRGPGRGPRGRGRIRAHLAGAKGESTWLGIGESTWPRDGRSRSWRTTRGPREPATRSSSPALRRSIARDRSAAWGTWPARSTPSCASQSGAWARPGDGSPTWCAAASTSPTSPSPTRRPGRTRRTSGRRDRSPRWCRSAGWPGRSNWSRSSSTPWTARERRRGGSRQGGPSRTSTRTRGPCGWAIACSSPAPRR